MAFFLDGVPTMRVVNPDTVTPGTVLKVEGEFLDSEHVAKVFLTDGKTDYEMQVLKQAAAKLEARVPDDLKPGKFFLMVLTTGSDGMLIEQPVKVQVNAPAAGIDSRPGTAANAVNRLVCPEENLAVGNGG
ncbi:MAG: hypothetical protein FJW39_30995 [Acidobacteria bacterium]|nr:hypothetical protein [Acidobacteriota bacterium]